MMSRGGRLILGRNTKGCEVSEHIATKLEVDTWMISKLKNTKSIWSMKPGEKFETSMVGPLGVLVALFKRNIWQGSFKSGIFVGRPSMSPFLEISFSLKIETRPKRWRTIWERFCFDREQTVETIIFLFLWGFTLNVLIWS